MFRFQAQDACQMRYSVQNWGGHGEGVGTILGHSMLCECMRICVLSSAHECEMRGSLVHMLIVKCLPILFKFSHSILRWTALPRLFFRGFKIFFFRGVCRPYRSQVVSRSSLILFAVVWPVNFYRSREST